MKTKQLVLTSIFLALIIVGAFIKIPIPLVPFTLQFLFTSLAGLLLGPKIGSITVAIYILMGILGLPVFAEGGGLYYIFKPTFGYIIGFLLATYVTGKIAYKDIKSYFNLLKATFAGLLIIYTCGMIYYYFISAVYLGKPIDIWPLFLYCFILAVPGDIAICFTSAILAKRLIPILNFKGDKTYEQNIR